MDFTPVMHNTLLAGTDPADSAMLRRLAEKTSAIGIMAATVHEFMHISKTLPFTEIIARENGETRMVDYYISNAKLADRGLFAAKKLGLRKLTTIRRIAKNYSNPDMGRRFRSDVMHLILPDVVISLPRIRDPLSMRNDWDRGRMPRSPRRPENPHSKTYVGVPQLLPERAAFVTVHIAEPVSAHDSLRARQVLTDTWEIFEPLWISRFPEGRAPDIKKDFVSFPQTGA